MIGQGMLEERALVVFLFLVCKLSRLRWLRLTDFTSQDISEN